MRFIELTNYHDEEKLYINTHSIESVYKVKAKGFHSSDWECTVISTCGSTFRVIEPINEVMKLIHDSRY